MNWYKTSQSSIISDDLYIRAVKSKEFSTVQHLVNEVANAAGYTLETEHQTIETFTEFLAGSLDFTWGNFHLECTGIQ